MRLLKYLVLQFRPFPSPSPLHVQFDLQEKSQLNYNHLILIPTYLAGEHTSSSSRSSDEPAAISRPLHAWLQVRNSRNTFIFMNVSLLILEGPLGAPSRGHSSCDMAFLAPSLQTNAMQEVVCPHVINQLAAAGDTDGRRLRSVSWLQFRAGGSRRNEGNRADNIQIKC